MQVQSALLFESPSEIYTRVHRDLRPRSPVPGIQVRFRPFANANSFIRIENGAIDVKITDVLEGAPAPIQEALAYILLGKLYRRPVASIYSHRYRRWLNRADVRRQMDRLRSLRGRKFLSGGRGEVYHLDEIFESLNKRFFHGLMARPQLGWSRKVSRTALGHWDAPHNAIILSRILDRPGVPLLAVEYVLYHEMLHLRHPVEHNGSRRCVHTSEFKRAEKEFPRLAEARELLKKL